MRRWLAIGAAAIALAATPAAAEPVPRDQQWQYFDHSGDGSVRRTAIFLSWDYSHVLFVATCAPDQAALHIRHPAYWPLVATANPDDHRPMFTRVLPMALQRRERRAEGRMHLENADSELVGMFLIDDNLLALLADSAAGELLIDVENETGDPWFAGAAAPLLRLAQGCRDAL